MLRVNLAAADERPIEVSGEVQPGDQALRGMSLDLRAPVKASGRFSSAGTGSYYWRGCIETVVAHECRRCLTGTETNVKLKVDAFFTDQPETDDPAVYLIPEGAQVLDLADIIREELVLSVSDFALCRDNCKGLCPQCGTDWNVSGCDCAPEPDPRWSALRALRDSMPGNEEH